MNKKMISLITTAAIFAASSAALADAPEVNVVVNGAKISFADQNAIIENDRTLIPARGAFEAMGASVEWDGDARTVTVKNDRNTKKAVLTIDSDTMIVTTYKTLFDVEKEEIKLDVPAQIMNDRTMIPLRAVGEAMGATVSWDGETYTATITTADGEKADAAKDELNKTEDTATEDTDATEDAEDTKDAEDTENDADVTEENEVSIATVSLSQVESETEDEIVVSVDLKGMDLYPEYYVAAVTLTLEYDKTALELTNAALTNGDEIVENSLGENVVDFSDSTARFLHITADEAAAAKADGSIMKLTFKKLKDDAGEISISTGYNTKLGYETSIGLDSNTKDVAALEGTKLIIDETPLKING